MAFFNTFWHNVDNADTDLSKWDWALKMLTNKNFTNAIAIANAVAIKSLKFSSEMMVLIKHLLVACLLREYEHGQRLQQSSSQEIQPTPSRDTIGQMETIAGAVNVDRKAEEWEAGCFVDAGQSSTRTRAAAATTTTETQRYTKLARIDTTTAAAATEAAAGAATRTSQLSGNVLAIATRTETKAETETLPTPGPSTSWNLNSNRNQNENEVQSRNRNENEPESEATNQTQAQINKAEIFRLPKNCVLQKILNLQLLVKVSQLEALAVQSGGLFIFLAPREAKAIWNILYISVFLLVCQKKIRKFH